MLTHAMTRKQIEYLDRKIAELRNDREQLMVHYANQLSLIFQDLSSLHISKRLLKMFSKACNDQTIYMPKKLDGIRFYGLINLDEVEVVGICFSDGEEVVYPARLPLEFVLDLYLQVTRGEYEY